MNFFENFSLSTLAWVANNCGVCLLMIFMRDHNVHRIKFPLLAVHKRRHCKTIFHHCFYNNYNTDLRVGQKKKYRLCKSKEKSIWSKVMHLYKYINHKLYGVYIWQPFRSLSFSKISFFSTEFYMKEIGLSYKSGPHSTIANCFGHFRVGIIHRFS